MGARKLLLGALAGACAAYTVVRALQALPMLQSAPPRRAENPAAYGRTRRALVLSGTVRSIAGTAVFAYGPIAPAIARATRRLPEWVRPGAFFAASATLGAMFDLPVEFVEDYALERSYGLSEQPVKAWFADSLKSIALAGGVAGMLGLAAGGALARFPKRWPLAASAAMLPLLIAANVVIPLYVLPLFNTFEPLRGPLEERLRALASRYGVGDAEILRMDMSRQTKKANAFVTGIGGTHRIVLGDTLIESFDPAEVAFVVAHELGHYVSKDTWRAIALGEMSTALLLVAAGRAVDTQRDDRNVALAKIFFILSLGMSLLAPATNAFSRSREWAADRFARMATGDPASGAAAFRRLRDQNLAEDELPAWFETLFASHPSLGRRIHALEHS